jgi:PIN domain nuclease of toxin-antitoxin system
MDYLLDTHTLIWFINGYKELSSTAIKDIESDNVKNNVSIASLLEMAIKISLERLELSTSFEEITEQIIENNFRIIQINLDDVLTLS